MYGSKRDKWTSFKGTVSLYTSICKHCDGKHEHESWKPRASGSSVVFPTSSEAEYPMEPWRTMMSKLSARQLRQFGKKQFPPLLSEYWLVTDSYIAALFPQAKALSSCPPGLEKGGDSVVSQIELNNSFAMALEKRYASLPGTIFRSCGTEDDTSKRWDGVHRNHLQAFHATLQLQHPMDMQVPIPDILLEAIFNALTLGAVKVLEMRAAQCKRILELVKDLETDERKFHDNMPKEVQSAPGC